ncbi:MAG: KamA family radical SAM protein, partial [Candidatus Hodarchaeota archaeon]
MTVEKIYADDITINEEFKSVYAAYSLHNFEKIPQIQEYCSEELIHAMKVVGHVLPFKTNNYVIENLIDWENAPNDPIFMLNFPHKAMLLPHHYKLMEKILEETHDHARIKQLANQIREQLNPQPAGQTTYNIPMLNGEPLPGMQHKYRETILFFPSEGQTCHAYCTFCFRWPQFAGMRKLKFASKAVEKLIQYVQSHDEVTDVLFTGGDPMVMKSRILRRYINPLLEAGIPNLHTIRVGTKSLSYWPYRYLEGDSDDVLALFEEIRNAGVHLSIMAHFNHPQELRTLAVRDAIEGIRNTGAEIRTQSPLLNHINADPDIWADMWRKQVDLGMIPYYMFIVRNTGARHYFELPLVKAWKIFHDAYQQVSGVCRTVRGPSMSSHPGKVQVLGPAKLRNKKVIVLRFLQGRNPDWTTRPFFAEY